MTITIAVAEEGRGEPEVLAKLPKDWATLLKHFKRLGPKESLRCCDEAGPTGYGLYRPLEAAGISCIVVAPTLVPEQEGKRVKTDRRDAVRLARFLRSGDLTAVYVPDERSEAIRDVVRARFDAKKAESAARQQLSHFLLRHGRTYTNGRTRTKRHLEWVRSERLEHEGQQRVLVDYLHVVEEAGERIRRLQDDVAELIQSWSLFELVGGLQALRGVSLIAAATIAAELGDLSRFESASPPMAYVWGSYLQSTQPVRADSRAASRAPATATLAGLLSNRPGATASARGWAWRFASATRRSPQR